MIAAYDQSMHFVANGRTVTARLRYNVTTQRWSLDLTIDDVPVLVGQRMPVNTDALAAYQFGIGSLMLYAENDATLATYENVQSGIVQLVHIDPSDLA